MRGETKEWRADLQIMMLNVYEDDENMFKSILAGATGYILKRTPPAELLEAIRDLYEGGSPMSDQIARKVVQAFQQIGKSSKETENLSAREMEILSYLPKDITTKKSPTSCSSVSRPFGLTSETSTRNCMSAPAPKQYCCIYASNPRCNPHNSEATRPMPHNRTM